jgi:CheY-like chemotaxis protein
MKKLLIVDDEDAMRGLYRRRLSGAYEVFETGDPEEALALALEHKPDAILLDLKMPKFDGFELCQNFRSLSHTSELPIFVITGQSGNYKKQCEAMGAAGYFEKPIDFNKLKQTLTTTLERMPATRVASAELRMRIPLKLKGTDAGGEQFAELVETESISADGFLCVSDRKFEEGSRVEVFLASSPERYAGVVRVTERVPAGLERQGYRCNFDGERTDWIIQKS